MLALFKSIFLLILLAACWVLWRQVAAVPKQFNDCLPATQSGKAAPGLAEQMTSLQSEFLRLQQAASAPVPTFDQLVDQASGRKDGTHPQPAAHSPSIEREAAVQSAADMQHLETELARIQGCLNKLQKH